MKLADAGEDELVRRLLRLIGKRSTVGPAGDDCAVVKAPHAGDLLLLKTDCVVEGIHFDSKARPAMVGWKAMMRPLSDFAAMSGVPHHALVTLVTGARTNMRWVTELYRSLDRAAARFDVSIVGGETSGTHGPTVISVSVAGSVEKGRWVSRAGGKPGDALFVTGRLGGSRAGKHLRFVPRIDEARWLTSNFPIHAMMDLSDGLGADLPRLARASKVGFQIEVEQLPRNRGCSVPEAINDGEDYELLFALSPRHEISLLTMWRKQFPKLPLTRIGFLNRKSECASPARRKNRKLKGGYAHFR